MNIRITQLTKSFSYSTHIALEREREGEDVRDKKVTEIINESYTILQSYTVHREERVISEILSTHSLKIHHTHII